MKRKDQIVTNWLPRYTGRNLDDFTEYILLTNFNNYVEKFAALNQVEIQGRDRPMPNATADGIADFVAAIARKRYGHMLPGELRDQKSRDL